MTRRWLVLVLCALPACGGKLGESLGGPFLGVGSMAVSDDGVFFTSNPNGKEANLSLERLPLAGGTPTTLVPRSASVVALALDATNAYVVDAQGIAAVAQAGGTPTTLVGSDVAATVSGLAVAGSAIVWIERDPSSVTSGQIWTAPVKQPATPVPPGPLSADLPAPCAIAADAAHVYWLDCSTKELASLPLDAGPTASPKVLATGLALPDGQLATAPLAAAGGFVFWGEPGSGAIRKVAASGGSQATLTTNAGQVPSQIVTDGAGVYWLLAANAENLPSSVWKVAAGGGTATEVLSPDQNSDGGYTAIALDASYLYVADNGDGSIRRVAR